jgi:hypothetical protein
VQKRKKTNKNEIKKKKNLKSQREKEEIGNE